LRLKDSERRALEEVAAGLLGPSMVALCAYGSKVAGYARPDSDYDILIVGRRYTEGVRYKYVKEPVEVSALIVDERMLRLDAKNAYLGEFVAGRFLNVYDPIINGDFLREVEVDYKARVISEALIELSSDYGDFNRHVVVPYEYFLFDKLRKRSQVYPPALYSYVQTYTCPSSDENKAVSVDGFRKASEAIAGKGFIVAGEDGVKLVPEKMKGDAFTLALSLFSLTARGVTQYAVHGYAGRVGFGVFRKEAFSKLKRMREHPEPPRELDVPRSLLRLEEGRFVADAASLKEELAGVAGFSEWKATERVLGDPYATTKLVTIKSATRERSFVVKNFSDVRSLKWAILGVWAATARKFSTSPIARLEREYSASLGLRSAGVLTPKIAAVAPAERLMAKDFIDGPSLSKLIDGILKGRHDGLASVTEYGYALGKVHASGMALGDAKASNVVVSRDGLYLTDLEQTVRDGDKAWDLAEFLYFTAKLSNKEDNMREVAVAFLKGYESEGEKSAIQRARSNRYLAPFMPFLTPGMSGMLKDVMADFS
jgi:tRNA A-37 threonylcarbamoyl transferase component Bud32/predicted nucleotidyltransferase